MKGRSGFTLIELMIVIVIIGIIASIAIPKFEAMKIKANAARIVSDFNMFQNALMRYYYNTGKYPPDRYPGGSVPELDSSQKCRCYRTPGMDSSNCSAHSGGSSSDTVPSSTHLFVDMSDTFRYHGIKQRNK